MLPRTLALTLSLVFVTAMTAQTKKTADDLLKNSGDFEVEVILKNDAVFVGVVLENRFVEVSRRAVYKLLTENQTKTRGAGIRLWYYADLQGYLFLPYRQIREVKKKRRLTSMDIDGIKARVAKAREAKMASSKAARKNTEKLTSADRIGTPPNRLDKLDDEQRKLLEEFSPKKGWVPELYAKIQSDMIMLGTEMTPEQDKWTGVYPEWLAAYRALTAEPEVAKKPAPKTPAAKVEAPKEKAPSTSKPKSSLSDALKSPTGSTVKKKSSKGRGLK